MALTADKTFYPTAKMAMDAPKEELAYVATLNVKGKPDSLCTVDVNPESSSYLNTVSELVLPNIGDELHHFGWNACSAHLCPYAPHPDNPTAWTAQRHNGCKVASWGGQYVGTSNIESENSWDHITLCSCFKEPCSNSANRLETEIKYE